MRKIINVALAGLPNAGKSTLLNHLVGEKISIISPKVQTTRDIIRGILIEGDVQMVLIDTPGIFIPRKDRPLERKIVKTAWSGIRDSDVVCVLVDSTSGFSDNVRMLIDSMKTKEIPMILVLNKVDAANKNKLLELTKEIADYHPDFDEVFMISAKKGDNVDRLKTYLLSLAQEGEWVYEEDDITDAPMKFLASEITREKLFMRLNKELPYAVDVETESWQELPDGSIKIQQVIFVLQDSQKGIVLGRRGQLIKEINMAARSEIEEMTERKVHLYLFVKVKNNWVDQRFGEG